MDRAQKAIRNLYLKGLADFTHDGLAPPPTVVASGELPLTEAVAQLMTLHDDALRRVRKQIPVFDSKLADLGPDVMVAPLLRELADFYHLPVEELTEGFALRDDPDAVADRDVQPRLATGELDHAVLRAECDDEFERNGWGDRLCTVEGYATPYDPRLPLVRSQIALRPEGLAWVSCLRPQNFQVARFEGLRLIHQQSTQWCLEFVDWRRRRLADRLQEQPWEDFLHQLRQLSGPAGFEWPVPTVGRRDPTYDSVIYNVSGWSQEERAALTQALDEAAIPHQWDGSDLRIPNDYEKKVDRIIDG